MSTEEVPVAQSLDAFQMSEQIFEILSSGLISPINHDDQLELQKYFALESKLQEFTEWGQKQAKIQLFVADIAGRLLTSATKTRLEDLLGTSRSDMRKIEQDMTEIKASCARKYPLPLAQIWQVFFSLDQIPRNFLRIYADQWIIWEEELLVIIGAMNNYSTSVLPRSSASPVKTNKPQWSIQARDDDSWNKNSDPVTWVPFVWLAWNIYDIPE